MLKDLIGGLFGRKKGPITYYRAPGDVKDGNVGAVLNGAQEGKHAGLDLTGAKLSERGMAKIQEASWIRGLKLVDAEINDAAVAALAGCPALEVLDLSGSPIVGACFQKINGKLPALRELRLARTKLMDQAIPTLCKLKTIELLDVSGTKLTEMVVIEMVQMPALKTLKMKEIPLDAAVLASLTDKRPVHIEWDLDTSHG